MNHLLDDTDEDQPQLQHRGADREITLGTTTILLIFFALAVFGAVTFGFGYSLGSKHSSPAPAVAAAPSSSAFGSFSKPSPGSPVGAQAKAQVADTTPIAVSSPVESKAPAPVSEKANAPADNFTAPVKPPPAPAAAAVPVSAATPTQTLVVQIAAVSHVEDAQMIATTLQKRGYSVNIIVEADKLAHVQVGPFSNRKDAEAMKARLLADGFNAYIK